MGFQLKPIVPVYAPSLSQRNRTTIMQLSQIQDTDFGSFLTMIFRARRTPYIKGPPGSGKSAMAEAYARRMNELYAADGGYGYFEIDMSKANIADWAGFMMPKPEIIIDADGQPIEIMAGKYTYPYWAYDKFTGRPLHSFKRGMVVFEEWAQGDTEVKRASSSFLHGRRMGLWHFPEMDCVLLGNRDIDRAGTTKEYDHIINRLTIVEMKPTLQNFLVVANELGMTPITMAFAARNTKDVFDAGIPKEQGPYLTQRSLHAMDDIIKAAIAEGSDLEDVLVLTAANGTIGMAGATAYMAFVKARHEIPTVSQVVNDPMGTKTDMRLDLLTFLIYDLASKVDRSNIGPIAAYIMRLQSDMSSTFFDAATRRDPSLVMTKEFTTYSKANVTLNTAAVMRR